MKRFLVLLLGWLLILSGAAFAALGGVGLAVFGTDGSYDRPAEPVAGSDGSLALVADLGAVEVDIPYQERLGATVLTAESADAATIFLGRAQQADVDAYLFGVPYDLATKNGAWTTTAVPGVEAAVAVPTEQEFWLDRAAGTTATIGLDLNGDAQTLVVMNADATAPVTATLMLSFRGEMIFTYSAGSIAAGVVLILVGMAILVGSRRRRKKSQRAAAERAAIGQEAGSPQEAADVVLTDPGEAPIGQAAVGVPSSDDRTS